MLYGPPPDPKQYELALTLGQEWPAYLACLLAGLCLSALALLPRLPKAARAGAFVLGQVVLLTAPLGAFLNDTVYGSFPTPDKNGQLQFYLRGVHKSLYLHPIDSLQDPAVKLIGVHAGHHWVTEFFDLFLQGYGALNIQALLWPALGWFCAALMLKELCGSWRTAVIVAMPFGLGLHVFRDLNWHTIEKTSVALMALYAWSLLKVAREGGWWRIVAPMLFLLMALDNLYLALVAGVAAGLLLLGTAIRQKGQSPTRYLAVAILGSALLILPLGIYQSMLLEGTTGKMADPDAFLYERAMLDTLSVWPLQWNRLELWRAVNLPWVGAAGYVLWRDRRSGTVQALGALALVLTLLALGPKPLGVWNPLYMGLRLLPGLWRLATPEVFFEGAYLCILGLACLAPTKALPRWVYPIVALGWVLIVRTHPAFPGFSALVEVPFSESWALQMGLD